MKEIAKTCHAFRVPGKFITALYIILALLLCLFEKKKAFFEPTSVPKSLKLFNHHETLQVRSIRYISPNQFELDAMSQEIESTPELYKQIKPNKCIHTYGKKK